MGAYNPDYDKRYSLYRGCGYEFVFRLHSSGSLGQKKGNTDTGLVFLCMRDIHEDKSLDKVLIVTRGGDYFRMVDHLCKSKRLAKVLLPSHKNASSLYKALADEYRVYLDRPSLVKKLKKTK